MSVFFLFLFFWVLLNMTYASKTSDFGMGLIQSLSSLTDCSHADCETGKGD